MIQQYLTDLEDRSAELRETQRAVSALTVELLELGATWQQISEVTLDTPESARVAFLDRMGHLSQAGGNA